jgi:O-antigen ligase
MEMTSGVAIGLLFGMGFPRARKLIVAIAAAIMGMAIIFTGSRGGLISYLGVVAFAAIASFVRRSEGSESRRDPDVRTGIRRNLIVATVAVGLVIVVLGSVLFLGGESSLLRGTGLVYEQSADVTSGRSHFWSIAWQIFLAHPVLGAGFDAFGVAFTRYDTWNGQFRVEQAHNDYLQILADGGIVTFLCVAAFVFLLLKKGISAITSAGSRDIERSISTGALAGCFGILVHSFFDFPLRTPANALFFLLLVVLAVEYGPRVRSADTTTGR